MAKPLINLSDSIRIVRMLLGLAVLGVVYVFQKATPGQFLLSAFKVDDPSGNLLFSLNRTIRLVANDLACILIISGLFQDRKYQRVAWFVFAFEFFFLLPIYLILKLSLEGDTEISSPLLSQIHRLIVNPMLMILVITSFFYQTMRTVRSKK